MAEERVARIDWRDLLGLAGACLVSYGTWLIYQPAAFIVAGLLAIAMACASARR